MRLASISLCVRLMYAYKIQELCVCHIPVFLTQLRIRTGLTGLLW